MPVIKYQEIELSPLEMEDTVETRGLNVIGPPEGWENHTLRLFRIEPGGHTPHHQHDWPHINHVVSGKGTLTLGDTVYQLTEKDFAFVPPNTLHQFTNPHDEPFEFICIVPQKAYGDQEK